MTTHAYDEHYFATGCGRKYERNAWWLDFFQGIADNIIAERAPASVLDVGCAMGFLVEGFRNRGVAAYGIDISEYALDEAAEAVRPFVALGSATDPLPSAFPERFDLVTCIEVLEHLSPAECDEAVARMCALTDAVLFSSTPSDHAEVTHVNVQPPEYWAGLFARHGFLRDLDADAGFLTPWARLFRRSTGTLVGVVRDYERRLWHMEQSVAGQRAAAEQLRSELADRAAADATVEARTLGADTTLSARTPGADATAEAQTPEADTTAEARAATWEARATAWEARWLALENSPSGAVVRLLQGIRGRVAPPGGRLDRLLSQKQ
jgi:SAM-dependent methyltransferase